MNRKKRVESLDTIVYAMDPEMNAMRLYRPVDTRQDKPESLTEQVYAPIEGHGVQYTMAELQRYTYDVHLPVQVYQRVTATHGTQPNQGTLL